jgi:hypothetical protein
MKRVAYAYLIKRGDVLRKVLQVLQIKIVPGVDTKAKFVGNFCSLYIGCNGLFLIGGVIVRVGFGIQLNTVGTG